MHAKSKPNSGIIIQLNWNACQIYAMQFHQINVLLRWIEIAINVFKG